MGNSPRALTSGLRRIFCMNCKASQLISTATTDSQYNAHISVQDRIGRLHGARVGVEEDGAEETDLLDGVVLQVDRNAIADVVRVLHEQEDDAREHLRETCTDQPAQPCARKSVLGAHASGWKDTHRAREFLRLLPAWRAGLPVRGNLSGIQQ